MYSPCTHRAILPSEICIATVKYILPLHVLPRRIAILPLQNTCMLSKHMFKLREILKVTDIYKLQCALFVHDYMHNKLPISFNDSFTKTAIPNSRQSSNLFRHRPRTKFSSRLPKHKFPVIWNSLSHDHHSITSRNIFKKTLKRSFLDNYTPVDHPCSNPLCPDCVTTH